MSITQIQLTQGLTALIDYADYERISKYKWYPAKRKHTTYAMATVNHTTIYMHRLILRAPKGKLVDHIDGNGLNNTRGNLRLATFFQNNGNVRNTRSETSPYKGVRLNVNPGGEHRWRASISYRGAKRELGTFDTPQEAAAAYDRAAIEQFGEFAYTNFEHGGNTY
jgi:hypothetical protein